jgi:putative NADH-flavin reductase
MARAGIRRLVAVTGIGSGETRGHGGWFYNWVLFPLFTRNRYADKDRQEALIEASGLDWTIVRPAPFSDAPPRGTFQVVDPVPQRLQLTQVHPREVADFLIDEVEQGRHLRKKPFIGHEPDPRRSFRR